MYVVVVEVTNVRGEKCLGMLSEACVDRGRADVRSWFIYTLKEEMSLGFPSSPATVLCGPPSD